MPSRILRTAVAFTSLAAAAAVTASCVMDRAPRGLRRTPEGPGATVRFDLAHRPLPDIPLPSDTATWPDPTSRTGLRVNASLVAPTSIETRARERFTQMEGWGTFSPITVSFDVPKADPGYAGYEGPALDLGNINRRHRGDDYDFADDAVYVINLTTGVPAVLDLGAGNFSLVLRSLDKYWANDTRASERNLLFDTIDESKGGAVTAGSFKASDDTDFDGMLDIPNLDDPRACPDPDPVCDNPMENGASSPECAEKRRARDRCISDHLLTYYERETDTLILRPLLPLDEMTRYAVVVTDRAVDGRGYAVKSPFEFVYHASMESAARRVRDILNDPRVASCYGDLHGTGLDHVAFTWSFTTQPTVDDMKRLRDGLYGAGPFKRWGQEFPARIEVSRSVGLLAGLGEGATEAPGWESGEDAKKAGCPIDPATGKVKNLFVVDYDAVKGQLRTLVVEGFGFGEGPGTDLLLKKLDAIDHMVVGTFKSPFLLEGGPKSTDPNAAFRLSFVTGEGEVHEDTVQFWLVVPKATAEHKQPFDVNIYGHGYTGNFSEQLLYAGNMAEHGLATIGINAMGHGLSFDAQTTTLARALLGGACAAPFSDGVTSSRARDLDSDGEPDSGGDFWSSYLFHTRDGVRQSVLDHVQLVRILRAFGEEGAMLCRDEATGWDKPAASPCDMDRDGKPEIAGDFDADGTPDVGGKSATYGTWGESLGGILSAIHGALDAYVTTAVPGSGGGGLADIGLRSFQGGVVEAVLLRIWGPLLVTVPVSARTPCGEGMNDRCTLCEGDEVSLRWVMPDVNGTGEVEIGCHRPEALRNTTALVSNLDSGELRCARVGKDVRLRVGLPASIGDRIDVSFYEGADIVKSYGTCELTIPPGTLPRVNVSVWGPGRYAEGTENAVATDVCGAASCSAFQGRFFGEGTPLTAPAEGFGQIRQTPGLRRFLALAQAALDPGDPISFAPYYSIKTMTDPSGAPLPPHAVLTLNTIGDMNVPLNAGIAFARATGALPFFRPDQAALYPEYASYATPSALFEALGQRTPNQDLIDRHVIEGITRLARHPAGPACEASANADPLEATFTSYEGGEKTCYPECPQDDCYSGTHCDMAAGRCVPNALGPTTCAEALFDVDDLDEGAALYHEESAAVPHRLARYTQAVAQPGALEEVWGPRLLGVPFGQDGAWTPDPARPLTALLDAYVVPEGTHTFVNGEPCQSFDVGTYLTNLTARFFMTKGTDLYYLSHPSSHHCLGDSAAGCGYLKAK